MVGGKDLNEKVIAPSRENYVNDILNIVERCGNRLDVAISNDSDHRHTAVPEPERIRDTNDLQNPPILQSLESFSGAACSETHEIAKFRVPDATVLLERGKQDTVDVVEIIVSLRRGECHAAPSAGE
ncbi:hypothetical protein L0M16_09025 [Mycolicibacterium sp. YH-1]|nr:hypothetical protein [Mycolicibacterium sp. YH-1]UNB54443.1 hypothetical protein L0M16_09025 [Mycolicibacterium sp. YH-1]